MAKLLRRRLVVAAAVLMFATLSAPVSGTSCSVMTSCGSCRNTTLCHWCQDQQCHAEGSIHGCLYGTYCYSNEQCERKEPEYRGYETPSMGVILGVFLVGGTALVCGIAAISVAREFSKESAASRERDAVAWLAITPRLDSARAAPSSGGSGGGNGNGSGGRDDEYAIIIGDDGNNTGSGLTNEDDDLAAGEEGDTDVRTKRKVARGKSGMVRRARQRLATGQSSVAVDPPGPTRLARKVYFFTRLICGTGMAAALLICVVIVAFAPHAPGVNVCNTQFDWRSIVYSLEGAAAQADFQLLVSIYNPNVLDAKIESGTAVLYHKHIEIGMMAFEPVVLEGGYVTDTLLTITFDADVSEEAKLGLEYETKKLAFLMDASVSASVMWHGFKTYPFTFSVHNYYIKVSDTTEYDRSLCNCSQMMQGTLHSPSLLAGKEEPRGVADEVISNPPMMTAKDGRVALD